MGSQNNNDISLFQKIIFVDNIPNEEEAKRLSEKYPFCVFVTDDNEDGPKGITQANTNGASSNMWKGGHRLTKFINVDPEMDNIGMDTYSIKLTFDSDTGLLGIKTVQKIEDYKLIGITYKKKDNSWRTFVNKSDITADINAHRVDNITMDEWEDDEMNYDELSYNGSNESFLFDTIDSVDNKLYFIIRYFARDAQGLSTVPIQSFDIISNNNEKLEIIGTPEYAEQKLENILDGNSQEKESKKQIIGKYTCRFNPSNEYAYIDVMYELQLKDNATSATQVSFSFDKLKDVFNPMNVIYNTAWINPLSFKLFINDIEINDNENPFYVMPSDIATCVVKMTPSNVRPLQLSLNSFEDDFINTNAALIYNSTSNDVSDTFTFYVACPSEFTYRSTLAESLKTTPLSFRIKNRDNYGNSSTIQYESLEYIINQYIYYGLELNSNPWTPYGLVTSGDQLGFNTHEVYALFTDLNRSVVKKREIQSNDDGISVGMTLVSDANNYEPSTVNLPSTITLGSSVSIVTPWIKITRLLAGETNKTQDYICVTYSYHGYTDNTSHNKYIKADTLTEIRIASNGVNSIAFEEAQIASGTIAHIIKRAGTPIEFIYSKGQVIDGFKWGYGESLNTLKDNIIIGLEGSALLENNHLTVDTGNSKINYQSDDAREQDNTVIAKLKYEDKISTDYISVIVNKLIINWYVYIGPIDWTENGTVQHTIPAGTYTLNNHHITLPSIPGENDGNNVIPNNGVDPAWLGPNTDGVISVPDHVDGDFTFYKGGWINIGKKDDVIRRGDDNPLWGFSDVRLIMTANAADMTDSTRTSYLIISPVGITWEDAFRTTKKDNTVILPQCTFAKDTYNMTVVPQEFMFGLLEGFNYKLYYKANT